MSQLRKEYLNLTRFSALRIPATRGAYEKILRGQVAEFAKGLLSGSQPGVVLRSLRPSWIAQLVKFKENAAGAMAAHGFRIAGAVLGSKSDIQMLGLYGKAAVLTATFDHKQTQVRSLLKQPMAKWIAETSKRETATSAKLLEASYRISLLEEKPQTVAQLAKQVLANGLGGTKPRAEMLSRVLVNWSYNKGAQERYKADGIRSQEWVTTMDAVTGDWDAAMDGTIIAIGESFAKQGESHTDSKGRNVVAPWDIEHPPLHPNCRCALAPVVEDIISVYNPDKEQRRSPDEPEQQTKL